MLTSRRPLRQKRYSVGMNARIADAGTKYLAISTVCALFERAPPLVSRQRVSDSQSSRPLRILIFGFVKRDLQQAAST